MTQLPSETPQQPGAETAAPSDEVVTEVQVEVPEGRFYVLGDHRDAVRDSRLSPAVGGTGLVAAGQVIGRVDMVVASAEGRHWWDPRGWRLGRIGEIVR